MAWTLDARIPVVFLDGGAIPPGRPAAVVSEAPPGPLPAGAVAGAAFEGGVTSHAAACACCQGRSPAAQALDRLFQARARGACAWFDRVAVTPEAADAVRAALREDAVAAARFRAA
ncbi:MAG: hypothetical protein K2X11_22510 [Acetobacteraceae bacterium]|nr:hypothetical protein [Acetobacteraceae bacterium]